MELWMVYFEITKIENNCTQLTQRKSPQHHCSLKESYKYNSHCMTSNPTTNSTQHGCKTAELKIIATWNCIRNTGAGGHSYERRQRHYKMKLYFHLKSHKRDKQQARYLWRHSGATSSKHRTRMRAAGGGLREALQLYLLHRRLSLAVAAPEAGYPLAASRGPGPCLWALRGPRYSFHTIKFG